MEEHILYRIIFFIIIKSSITLGKKIYASNLSFNLTTYETNVLHPYSGNYH